MGPDRNRRPYALSLSITSGAASAHADYSFEDHGIPERPGVFLAQGDRSLAERRRGHGERGDAGRNANIRGRLAGGRRRRSQHGAQVHRRGVRRLHLGRALPRGEHDVRLRAARLRPERVPRRSGGMGCAIQDARRRAAGNLEGDLPRPARRGGRGDVVRGDGRAAHAELPAEEGALPDASQRIFARDESCSPATPPT